MVSVKIYIYFTLSSFDAVDVFAVWSIVSVGAPARTRSTAEQRNRPEKYQTINIQTHTHLLTRNESKNEKLGKNAVNAKMLDARVSILEATVLFVRLC